MVTDLAAYYDRQLSNIKSIIVESVGVDRVFIKLVARTLPSVKYYIYTGYGVSRESYGRAVEKYAGTGQGNQFSGESCKVKLGIIIQTIAEKDLSAIVKLTMSDKQMIRPEILFVDDTSSYSNRKECESKMQRIIKTYMKYHKAIERLVKYSKSYYYSQ